MKQSIKVRANHKPVCCGKPMEEGAIIGKGRDKTQIYSCLACKRVKIEQIVWE